VQNCQLNGLLMGHKKVKVKKKQKTTVVYLFYRRYK